MLLDKKLKPWLVEVWIILTSAYCTLFLVKSNNNNIVVDFQVNHSPSFHTDAPLDKEVKEGLLHDTFNLVDLYANDKKKCQEEDRRRVKERLLCRQKPKDSTTKDDDTREKYELRLESYERSHKGGFRKVYPWNNEADYENFFDQSTSLCAETAASKARTDLARQQKEEIEAKQKEREELRQKLSHCGREKSGKEDELLRPESPTGLVGLEKRNSVRTLTFKRRGTNFHLPLYSAGKRRRELLNGTQEEEVRNNAHVWVMPNILHHSFYRMVKGFPLYTSVRRRSYSDLLDFS